MSTPTIYLDSSAIAKRYIDEDGSGSVNEIYLKTLRGELKLAFSAWNVGEVLGVFEKYFRRGWLSEEDCRKAKRQFIGETVRLLRLRILSAIPVKTRLLVQTWPLLERHHIYEADALQLVSARHIKAQNFYTADANLHEAATKEGIGSVCVR
ncbi:MAG: type II toxin-antitoxin system VapC family toxin [Candidatus Methanosuratincola sp.]|jgi:predicted nucleic acid-binding protein|nr:type II toxin-antitoxin system VapC family toxin [Candidatus Methanosuratincola sp.]